MGRIGAWATMCKSDALLTALLAPWQHKLGVVLNADQAAWGATERDFVILNFPSEMALPADTLAVLGSRDEPNVTGPSGPYVPPANAASDALASRGAFKGVPVPPGALAFVGNWFQTAFCQEHFDGAYFARLKALVKEGPYAFNAAGEALNLLLEPLSLDPGPWLVCGELNRPSWTPFTVFAWLARMTVGTGADSFIAIADHPNVLAVTFWCLLQDGTQSDFGLYKPAGGKFVLSDAGKEVWRALMKGAPYPVVSA